MSILISVLSALCTLFILGFAFGALLGNPDMHPLKRGLCGGLFFAFFFVTIPVVVWQNRNA